MENLDLTAKGSLGDATIDTLLEKLFGARPDVVFIKPTSLCVVMDGAISINKKDLTNYYLACPKR